MYTYAAWLHRYGRGSDNVTDYFFTKSRMTFGEDLGVVFSVRAHGRGLIARAYNCVYTTPLSPTWALGFLQDSGIGSTCVHCLLLPPTQDASGGATQNPALLLAIIFSIVIASVCGLGVLLGVIIFGFR